MTRSKLSDTDKQELLALYRESAETISTLAERYGVSSTTIRRILKGSLLQQEYEFLTNQKQTRLTKPDQEPLNLTGLAEPAEVRLPEESNVTSRNVLLPSKGKEPSTLIEKFTTTTIKGHSSSKSLLDETSEPSSAELPSVASEQNTEKPFVTKKSLRKRSSATSTPSNSQVRVSINSTNLPGDTSTTDETRAVAPEPTNLGNFDSLNPFDSDDPIADYRELEEELDSDLDDPDGEDFEEDLEAETLESLGEGMIPVDSYTHPETPVQVLPLHEAAFPKTCYLVIDRSAELITRPLKDFSDLGDIPLEEIQERTLPIFDNHRVARRFSNRTQRVIKIPDGNMLQKTCFHLYSKGITRLLINGQVYSL